jgi:hypothetical protein
VMDHAEYDKKRWVDECGCHNPPPKQPASVKNATPKRKPTHRERKEGR